MKKLFVSLLILFPFLFVNISHAQVTSTSARRFVRFTGTPSLPAEGDVYYNLTSHKAFFYNGTSFVDMSGGGGTPGGSSGELQFNNAGAFGGLTGSSVSGSNLGLGGTLQIPDGTRKINNVTGDGFGFSLINHGPSFFNSTAGTSYILDTSGLTGARTATVPDVSGTLTVINATGTTVGVAGGATALPATPLGYITITLPDGSTAKIPYYNL